MKCLPQASLTLVRIFPLKGLAFGFGVTDKTDKVTVMTLLAKAQPFYIV